jgi:hypothetical protein
VPRIPREILQSVVYLYPTVENAEEGLAAGGTGFFTSVPSGDTVAMEHVYVVTAGHVVRQAPIVRANTGSGVEILDLSLDTWIHHFDGTDLAVAPLGLYEPDASIGLGRVAYRLYLSREDIEDTVAEDARVHAKVGPGDECFFVGRFSTHEGRLQNRPTVRFGNLAMLTGETIRAKESGLAQESFLVEARSLSGYSGSPVFIYNAAAIEPDGSISPFVKTDVRFLGVDWCHLNTYEPALDADKHTRSEPAQWVKRNTGMAGVIPAWKVTELLNDDEVAAMRHDETKKRQGGREERHGGAALDSAGASEFQRFRGLCPRSWSRFWKREVDEKREDES